MVQNSDSPQEQQLEKAQDNPDAEQAPDKTIANPFRARFRSNTKGFVMGEDFRFKQMVFFFDEKPHQETLDRLKEHGYRFYAADKSWRTAVSVSAREDASRLAQELHGGEQDIGR